MITVELFTTDSKVAAIVQVPSAVDVVILSGKYYVMKAGRYVQATVADESAVVSKPTK